ncbi:MAG: hypothetical protein HC833_17150 [Leptolyngbyaceae cyanobacterium RM1_406_9]|nr:hypothetical protein [Leptolyngbyaceae cyanobacterium RM1_406_9]
MSNPNEAQNFDAQQAVENIAAGNEKQPDVNVQADYEASKAYSTSEIDQSEMGAEAAKAATEPKQRLSEPESSESVETGSTSDPDQYRQMAKDVNPRL